MPWLFFSCWFNFILKISLLWVPNLFANMTCWLMYCIYPIHEMWGTGQNQLIHPRSLFQAQFLRPFVALFMRLSALIVRPVMWTSTWTTQLYANPYGWYLTQHIFHPSKDCELLTQDHHSFTTFRKSERILVLSLFAFPNDCCTLRNTLPSCTQPVDCLAVFILSSWSIVILNIVKQPRIFSQIRDIRLFFVAPTTMFAFVSQWL